MSSTTSSCVAGVPFFDMSRVPDPQSQAIAKAMRRVTERGAFILGEEVNLFEQAFAKFCETERCVGVGSGCDSLLWALEALGIGPGDEVITVANTFVGTLLPIDHKGMTERMVDRRLTSQGSCRGRWREERQEWGPGNKWMAYNAIQGAEQHTMLGRNQKGHLSRVRAFEQNLNGQAPLAKQALALLTA